MSKAKRPIQCQRCQLLDFPRLIYICNLNFSPENLIASQIILLGFYDFPESVLELELKVQTITTNEFQNKFTSSLPPRIR